MENSDNKDLLKDFDSLRVNNLNVEETTLDDSSPSSLNQAPAPVPVALYPESIWSAPRLSDTGNISGSNPQYETISSSDFQSPSTNVAFHSNPFEYSDGSIFLLAQDPHGSQYLQEKLFSGDSSITAMTFIEVCRLPFQFMKHQHGRFVFVKLIESCNERQRMMIISKITSPSQDASFVDAATEKLGSSSIKKLIKVLAKLRMIHNVMPTLNRLFNQLMINKFGSSIILQCLESRYNRENDSIYQAALEHCLTLACHEQGCISLNNFIDEMSGSRRKQILHLISMNADSLSANSFGNFVVQHVLKLENPELIEKICSALRGHYIDLSMEKGGSFVVQQCLKYPTMADHIVKELLHSDRIFQVAKDRYGNYVIQTALKETKKANRFVLYYGLVMKLQPHLPTLQFGYGKHVSNIIPGNRNLI